MTYVAFSHFSLALFMMSGVGCTLLSNGQISEGPRDGEAWLTLAELDHPRVIVDILQDEGDAAERLRLSATIAYDNRVTASGDCPVVWGLRARIGNEDLISYSYGGWSASSPRTCESPALSMPIAEDATLGDRTLRVTDETLTFEILIGDHLVRRRLYLSQPPLEGYRVGEPVTLRWLSSGDLDAALPALEVFTAAEQRVEIPAASITRQGDQLSFIVPSSLADLGIGRLRATYKATSSDCGGECALNVSYTTSTWLRVRAP